MHGPNYHHDNPLTSFATPPPTENLAIASGNRPRVDHTYRDFSRYLDEGGEVERHKKSGANFPAKLHQMLSDDQYSHIISWMPHGRAWKIRNKDLLMSVAVPKYLAMTKFESFTRQLSGWGFKRLHRPGPDVGCYYHECFLRGIPLLTWLMVRVTAKQGKPLPNPEGEPDFDYISRMHPLPPPPDGDSSTLAPYRAPAAGATSATTADEPARYTMGPGFQPSHTLTTYQPLPEMQSDARTSTAQDPSASFAQNSSSISVAMPTASYSPVPYIHSQECDVAHNIRMPITQDSSGTSTSSALARVAEAQSNEAFVDHYPPPYQIPNIMQTSAFHQEHPPLYSNLQHNPMNASYPAYSYPSIFGNSHCYESRSHDYPAHDNFSMDPEIIAPGTLRSQAQGAQYSNQGSRYHGGVDDHPNSTVQQIAAPGSLREEENSGQGQGTEHTSGVEGDNEEFDNSLNAFIGSFNF